MATKKQEEEKAKNDNRVQTTEEVIEKKHAANLTLAVLQVMEEVWNIEKNASIGKEGSFGSYKGIADKDVKYKISRAMIRAGLIMLPVAIEEKSDTFRWIEDGKQKQSIVTKIKVVYKLKHVSGEEELIESAGHGIDPQDKSIGKAMTYALKYALLYSFLVATGTIEDTDLDHSDEKPVMNVSKPATPAIPVETHVAKMENANPNNLPELSEESNKAEWDRSIGFLQKGGKMVKITEKYFLTKQNYATLIKHFAPKQPESNGTTPSTPAK